MDGLEIEYNQTVEFERINASTPEGLEIFNTYALFGHPGFLILDEQGELIWQSVGEQPGEDIESALLSAIEDM
ncbi:MAG: hypothetical protein GWN14_01555 [candidate division Zixibacteria bacterium]|nr:hypothetical protein [candidate division Zixibacteria bacterium]